MRGWGWEDSKQWKFHVQLVCDLSRLCFLSSSSLPPSFSFPPHFSSLLLFLFLSFSSSFPSCFFFSNSLFPSPPSDCVSDVLPQIARRCHAQPSCSFPVDDHFLGNPCPPSVSKYLAVIFVCVNEEVFSDAAIQGRLEKMAELERVRTCPLVVFDL